MDVVKNIFRFIASIIAITLVAVPSLCAIRRPNIYLGPTTSSDIFYGALPVILIGALMLGKVAPRLKNSIGFFVAVICIFLGLRYFLTEIHEGSTDISIIAVISIILGAYIIKTQLSGRGEDNNKSDQ